MDRITLPNRIRAYRCPICGVAYLNLDTGVVSSKGDTIPGQEIYQCCGIEFTWDKNSLVPGAAHQS